MAVIYNADKTIGNSKPISRWDSGEVGADARYSLHTSYYNYNFNKNGDGTYTYLRSRKVDPTVLKEDAVVNRDKSTSAFSITGFINNMQKFYYAPPSDNLWTVSIRLHSGSKITKDPSSLSQLYKNIIEANKVYDTSNVTSKWGINYGATVKNSPQSFIEGFSGENRIFLAQTVNFKPYALTVNENAYSAASAAGGFLTFGKILQSKNGGNECNISFLISNWDICEVLIDPWIAAIAKYGLIEDSSISNIKADIVLEEYSASAPKNLVSDKDYNFEKMVHRKTYRFFKAFPTNRSELSRNYEANQAGSFKTSTVNFKFDEYSITYHV